MNTYTSAAQAAHASKAWRELITATKAHEDARQAADPAGRYGNWFGKAEFAHFEAQLHGQPLTRPFTPANEARVYWVASTQFTGSDGVAEPRQYKIHVRDYASGGIDTLTDYPHYATADEANAAMRFIVLGENGGDK